jgi:hypothetical protein
LLQSVEGYQFAAGVRSVEHAHFTASLPEKTGQVDKRGYSNAATYDQRSRGAICRGGGGETSPERAHDINGVAGPQFRHEGRACALHLVENGYVPSVSINIVKAKGPPEEGMCMGIAAGIYRHCSNIDELPRKRPCRYYPRGGKFHLP